MCCIVPSMCEDPAEQRRQWLKRQLELMDMAYRGGEQFIAKQTPGIRPDSGGEWNFKHNPWGWQ